MATALAWAPAGLGSVTLGNVTAPSAGSTKSRASLPLQTRTALQKPCQIIASPSTSSIVPSPVKVSTPAVSKCGRRGGALCATSAVAGEKVETKEYVEQLKGAKQALVDLIKSKNCNPIVVRLAWHDSGTYDKSIKEWPRHGGANGSIRFKPEQDHAANSGLVVAINLLAPIQKKFPLVSFADLYQLASVTAIEIAGGPKINLKFGRVDVDSPDMCSVDGNLPAGDPRPAETPAAHLKKVFYRMGLNDQDIVALSGAHTLGRARLDRSGFGVKETKYTKDGPGIKGGQSWTVEWLKFDNSYFKEIKEQRDQDLLVLPTDAAIFEDPGFKPYAEKYAADQETFFKDYAVSHKKLSELGSKFEPPQGIYLEEPAQSAKPAEPVKFRAADYASQPKDYSDNMKKKMKDEYLGLGGAPDKPLNNNPFLLISGVIATLAILAKLTGALD